MLWRHIKGNVIHLVGFVVVLCDDDTPQQGFPSGIMEVILVPLVDRSQGIKDRVSSDYFVAYVTAKQHLLLMLPDRSDVPGPEFRFVHWELDSGLEERNFTLTYHLLIYLFLTGALSLKHRRNSY